MNNAQIGTACDATPTSSSYLQQHIQSLENILARTIGVANLLDELADRMLGTNPPNPNKTEEVNPTSSAVIGRLQELETQIACAVGSVEDTYSRLNQL